MNYKSKLAKTLTGDYRFGENSKNKVIEERTNANVEGGEWIEDEDGVKKLEGKRHSKGGMDILMQSGDRVLTDYTEIGKDLLKNLQGLGIKVSTKDTYSKVLDKYNKFIGLQAITDEEERYNKRLIDLENKVKDKNTSELNTQVLVNKINDLQEEKEGLIEQREELFNFLYADQESRKETEVQSKDSFQKGGGFFKRGIVTKSVDDARKQWERQRGVTFGQLTPTFRNPEDWKHQSTIDPVTGTYGPGFQTDQEGRLAEMARIFPDNFQTNLGEDVNPDNIRNYQNYMNEDRTRQIQDVGERFGYDSPEFKSFLTRNAPEMFNQGDDVFSVDGKAGDVTSQKFNNTYNVLPSDVYKKAQELGATTVGQLMNTPEGREIANQYYDGVDPSWAIGEAQVPSQINVGPDGAPVLPPTNNIVVPTKTLEIAKVPTKAQIDDVKAQEKEDKRKERLSLLDGVMGLPDRTPLAPGNVLPHLKTNPELNIITPEKVTPGEGLKELNRQRLMMMSSMEGMNPQARALALIAGSGNLQKAVEGLMAKTEDVNASNRFRADMVNKQSRDTFARERDASAMSYEGRTYKAEGLRDKEWRNYYRSMAKNNAQDWDTIQKMNAYNKLNPNVKYKNGQIVTENGQLTFLPPQVYQAPNKDKNKNKNKS